MKWKKYDKHPLHEHCECWWQKEIDGVYVGVLKYPSMGAIPASYGLDIQLQQNKSPSGNTINIYQFSYLVEDWKLFEKDARFIIKKLT